MPNTLRLSLRLYATLYCKGLGSAKRMCKRILLRMCKPLRMHIQLSNRKKSSYRPRSLTGKRQRIRTQQFIRTHPSSPCQSPVFQHLNTRHPRVGVTKSSGF